MNLITSQHNSRLKELRKLARARERARSGRFLAEGEDLVRAASAAGRPALEGFRMAGTEIGGPSFQDVEAGVLAGVSTLGSGTRAIGVYEQRFGEPVGPLCVYLHGVADPGNVGTVLRSALAFGASSVALGPGCADPHSPKAVRASMGAIFAVSIARVDAIDELPGERVALLAGAGVPVWEVAEQTPRYIPNRGTRVRARGSAECQCRRALTLLVGAEREGLPDDVVGVCERIAHIPIASESLNAAMAATVALYEITRPSTRVPAS
ncbi:MAG TPA: RNA methyltransferase [Solirubrobacteraceae bacterium]|jgi:TrmH family RNA methyltransferase